jgi:hypothetical protein
MTDFQRRVGNVTGNFQIGFSWRRILTGNCESVKRIPISLYKWSLINGDFISWIVSFEVRLSREVEKYMSRINLAPFRFREPRLYEQNVYFPFPQSKGQVFPDYFC